MYESSEDAIEANEQISFESARRELARHYASAQKPMSTAFAGDIFVRMDGEEAWETIQCTTKAILEWLGY